MRIEYHRTLIADQVRNRAFHDALKRVIKPGETVVADIGAGTGLMGLIAAKLGAREVYLYETAEVAGVAAEIIKANRAKACHLMPCHSTEMQDPPRADVIVSETLGNYALEENIIDTLADARKRHLKDGGVIIPGKISQFVVPDVSDRIHRELAAWNDVGFGLDLEPARTMSLNNVYVRRLEPDELLNGGRDARVWDEVDLSRGKGANRNGEANFKLSASATIYGFAYWWTAELVPGIVLSTAPDAPRTHWEQLYFPLLEPIRAKADETVMVSLRSQSSEETGTHLAWTAVHFGKDGKSIARQALDLDKGWLP
jgi:protein arginine N-methyltransferase 1